MEPPEDKPMINQLFRAGLVAVSTVCTLTACVSLRVTSDVNTAASASQCHSYAWAGALHTNGASPRSVANPLNEARLRSAIAANLAAKGVQPADANPDCLVGYGIGVQTVVDGGYPYDWDGWGGRRGFYGGWGWDYPYEYREGMVAVDLYDARSRQPLWHASVDQNVAGLTGAAADNKIKAAVAAIFTKYPS
jgi:hypothetical protein